MATVFLWAQLEELANVVVADLVMCCPFFPSVCLLRLFTQRHTPIPRLPDIGWWSKNQRTTRRPPTEPGSTLDERCNDWWRYWSGMMPPGREVDSLGRLTGREELLWDEFLYAGENGILIVLVSLRWWWDEIDDLKDPTGYTEWMLALEDVYWVIKQLTSSLRHVIHSIFFSTNINIIQVYIVKAQDQSRLAGCTRKGKGKGQE